MKTSYTQFLTALRQAQHFLSANATALGTVVTSGARATLDAVTASIATLAETQDTHRIQVSGERANELRLAEALRRTYLRPIARIAKAKLADVPQLSNVTLPPRSGNTTALVSRARAIADAVEPYAQVFVAAGMAPGFLDQLRAATDQVVQAIESKGEHRTGRTKATDAIGKVVRQARQTVGVLNALIRAELDPLDPVLTEWQSALRVIQRPAATKAPAPTPPVPTPVPTPVPSPLPTPAKAPASASNPASVTPAQTEVKPKADAA